MCNFHKHTVHATPCKCWQARPLDMGTAHFKGRRTQPPRSMPTYITPTQRSNCAVEYLKSSARPSSKCILLPLVPALQLFRKNVYYCSKSWLCLSLCLMPLGQIISFEEAKIEVASNPCGFTDANILWCHMAGIHSLVVTYFYTMLLGYGP